VIESWHLLVAYETSDGVPLDGRNTAAAEFSAIDLRNRDGAVRERYYSPPVPPAGAPPPWPPLQPTKTLAQPITNTQTTTIFRSNIAVSIKQS